MTDSPVARALAEASIWVVELAIDRQWYAEQEPTAPLPAEQEPQLIALREPSALVGRRSPSQNPTPEIDCGDDGGVSRRQAQLSSDGKGWWIEDLGSVNGTYVSTLEQQEAGAGFPDNPIEVGTRHPLGPYDRVYLGGWTRLTLLPPMDGRTPDAV
ncbi:FHA domain-containing protein [Microlunatus elymi]|uniref:FHA domain-containing protein n=1 Tax=Microlunatus elymi TaxID=2596828 RepID=A0A516PZ23_9ACTN|nr:FHA domain-containing protein [Microlunatus elymi]QDP96426.1 FHA domain-containing protein [Microlunatus elymi]